MASINFKWVRYKNFLSTGNQFTEIRLDDHKTTLISGKNGVGKTTLPEAIIYALYNRSLRNLNKPQLVNSITNKNLLVELAFDIANKSYLIRRGMKPGIFEIFVNDELIKQESAVKNYQEILENEILKIDYRSFIQVNILSMANYTPFMKLPAAQRRNVIEDLLDIQIFSVMNTLLKEKIQNNKSNLQEAEYNIKLIQNKIELHNKHLRELNQNNQELIKERKQKITEYRQVIRDSSKSVEKLQKEVSKYMQASENNSKAKDDIRKITTVITKTASLEKKIKSSCEFYETEETCPTCSQTLDKHFKSSKIDELNSKLSLISEKLPGLIEKQKLIQKKVDALSTLETKILSLNKKIQNHNNEILTANKFIDNLKQDIEDLEQKVIKNKSDNSAMYIIEEEKQNAETAKKELIEQKEVLLLASQLLKDGGIKAKIIQQYIPIMNKLINNYLAKMDFFVNFELDETFKETIKSRFRDEFSYENFSQGEKLRIDLALLFAWRAIAKMRNSANTNMLFFDEILDSSLDSTGIEEFLNIIKTLSGDTNLFIISHRSEHLMDKFDNVIRFEKKGNFSRIVD